MPNLPIKYASDVDFLNTQGIVNLRDGVNLSDAATVGQVEQVRTDLENTLQGRGKLTDIDCSTNPLYPATALGDGYEVTVEGLIGGASGVPVGVGDIIRCKGRFDVGAGEYVDSLGGDQATVGDEFYITEGNRVQATTNTLGLVKLATQVLVDGGTDTDTAVTPATLAQRISNLINTQLEYTTNVGDGVQDTFTITHPLATTNVDVVIKENSSGANYMVHWVAPTSTSVTLYFSTPPTVSQFNVAIKR